ncbi:MAG: hypothetical protein ACRDG3_01950 [Tepidiformaceae bacterium]
MTTITDSPRMSRLASRLGSAAQPRIRVHPTVVLVGGATALALAARLVLVVLGKFPLNDGGMFYVMARDLRANGWRLPAATTYNGLHLPFAYSPLGFYLADAVSALFHISLTHVFMYLPAVVSAATVPAAYLLFRAMMRSRPAAISSAFAFALLPQAFLWATDGGGVTRAPGLFFAILAVHQAHRLFVQRKDRALGPLALFIALALAAHLETGTWAATTCIVFVIAYRRDLSGVVRLGAAGVLSLLFTAPWWLTVVAQHGVGPFLNAGGTGDYSPFAPIQLVALLVTQEPGFPILAGLAALGAVVAVRRRHYFIAAWPLVIMLLDARAGATYAMLPIAMLAATGFIECLLPLLGVTTGDGAQRAGDQEEAAPATSISALLATNRARGAAYFVGGYATIAAIMLAFVPTAPTHALSAPNRAAMTWVSQNTPPDASFVVVSGQDQWSRDATAEWFPALAGRRSVGTVQATEWLGSSAFVSQQRAAAKLQQCAFEDEQCLESWLEQHPTLLAAAPSPAVAPQYVYVGIDIYADPTGSFEPCCGGLLQSLSHSNVYTKVFENDGAAVFKRVAPPPR